MRRRVLLYLTLISLSACNGDRIANPEQGSVAAPSNDISDATHDGIGLASNPDFFFLPPMVKNPSGSPQWNAGAFNARLRPAVDICAYDESIRTESALAYALAHEPPPTCAPVSSSAADVDGGEEQYHVNWKVPTSSVTFYRITVRVGSKRLGYADVETAANSSQLKNVATNDFIALNDGRTLPIKFRIEKYALCESPGDPKKPCTSATVGLGTGGTVETTLNPDSPEESGVIIPPQPTGDDVAVTVASCETFNPRVTDLPVFGPCVRVTFDPALTAALQEPATVYSCEVFEQSVIGGVTGSAQAERIALHELNPQSGRLVALPHAEPHCATPTTHIGLGNSLKQTMVALAHGRLSVAARQVGAMLSPRPAYAAMRFIDLGGGGGTRFGDAASDDRIPTSSARFSVTAATPPPITIRDFQFALPARFKLEMPAQYAAPGSTITVNVTVTDLGGDPILGGVRNARVQFAPSEGSSVSPTMIDRTPASGLASVRWTLGSTATSNTLVVSGRGIAGEDNNGPRGGADIIDPFQPLQTHWGDASNDAAPVRVLPGSVHVTVLTTGSISGRVVKASDGSPIAGATITAGSYSATSGPDGKFSLGGVLAGTYSVGVSATGYTAASRPGTVVTAGDDTPLGDVALTAPNGAIGGTLFNAFTNQPIGGATVTATPSAGGMATASIDIAPISAVSAANGTFTIPNVPAGTYDVTAEVTGFISVTRSGVVVSPGVTTSIGSMSASPVTTAGNVRIVLEWGACNQNIPAGSAPCDLDSHLTGPTSSGGRFHVFYQARTFSDLASTAALDVDDVSGLGPETITLSKQTAAGEYHYYVHDFTQFISSGAPIIASLARVRVFFGSELAATYFVPTSGTGALWDVFKLSGTTLTPVNTIVVVPSPAAIGGLANRIPLAPSIRSVTETADQDLQRIADDLARAPKQP